MLSTVNTSSLNFTHFFYILVVIVNIDVVAVNVVEYDDDIV